MALVKCKDCGNEVSDSAASCPKCGAPVPKVMGAGEEQCPFCETVVSSTARVCKGCGARKGYTHAQGNVYGKGQTIAMGIVVPAILAIIALMFNAAFGTIVLLIMLIPIVLSSIRLKKGEIWFRSTNVYTG